MMFIIDNNVCNDFLFVEHYTILICNIFPVLKFFLKIQVKYIKNYVNLKYFFFQDLRHVFKKF